MVSNMSQKSRSTQWKGIEADKILLSHSDPGREEGPPEIHQGSAQDVVQEKIKNVKGLSELSN